MNLDSLKRFLKNKNTVTIIGVIAILGLLYFGYSTRVNQAINGVSIPVAKQQIDPKTMITDDMVTTIEMPAVAVSGNVIQNRNSIVGMYSRVNTIIPEGSMFYEGTLMSEKELPDAALMNLKKGQIVYSFPVDIESTYGNSILPGSKVDIYMKVGNGSDEKVMVGKLLGPVEVLAMKDSSGQAVFESSDGDRTPSMMLFGLSKANWLLLSKASYLYTQGVELFPVPQGSASADVQQSTTQQLVDYINARSVDIPIAENTEPTTDDLVPTIKVTEKNGYKVTITYPQGCGTTYICSYSKDNGASVIVEKKTSQVVNYNKAGTLIATVTEKDGTEHSLNTYIPIVESNSNSGQAG